LAVRGLSLRCTQWRGRQRRWEWKCPDPKSGSPRILPRPSPHSGDQIDALFIVTDPMLFTNRMQIHGLALDTRLPTICDYREYVEAGCLLSYGPSHTDLFRRTAGHVDKILRGANPGDLPVEQPTKFEYVLNLKTAKRSA
jgi:ABC-type uncharacterized transport system substrate-binding protein